MKVIKYKLIKGVGWEGSGLTLGKEYLVALHYPSGGCDLIDDDGGTFFANSILLREFFSPIYEEDSCDPIADYFLSPEKDLVKTEDKEAKPEGLRFNNGKIRYDLLHPIGTEGIAKVMTKGALKYEERNWEKGMKWSTVLASMKRHTAAFEQGVDYDIDPNCQGCKDSTKENWVCKNHTGELHVDLIQTNAHFLSAYYKIYPQGDDRRHDYLKAPKIGLDIDEVLCDWVGDWTKRFDLPTPTNWYFDSGMLERFEQMKEKGELDDFYLSLQPLIKPEDIPFEPHCYITSRPVSSQVTERWLALFGFPARPVFTTTKEMGKVEIAKREGIDIFVDDAYHNFIDLNKAGICCFLMDAKHNQRYEVGYKRIKQLKDLTW